MIFVWLLLLLLLLNLPMIFCFNGYSGITIHIMVVCNKYICNLGSKNIIMVNTHTFTQGQ